MINKFKYFLDVAKTEHFRLSAESLFITQPALSASMARFEKELGVKLFNRTGRNVKLTDVGKLLIPDVEAICDHYENIIEIVDQNKKIHSENIRFGSLMRHSVLCIDRFLKKNTCYLSFKQFSSNNYIKQSLTENKIDICTSYPPVRGHGIETIHLINEPLCLLMNKSHPLAGKSSASLEEVSIEKVIQFPISHPLNITIDNIYKQTGYRQPEYVMTAENEALILFLTTSSGKNCMLINPISRCKELMKTNNEFTYVPLSDDICFREIGVSWMEKYPLTKNGRDFIQCLQEYYSYPLYSNYYP